MKRRNSMLGGSVRDASTRLTGSFAGSTAGTAGAAHDTASAMSGATGKYALSKRQLEQIPAQVREQLKRTAQIVSGLVRDRRWVNSQRQSEKMSGQQRLLRSWEEVERRNTDQRAGIMFYEGLLDHDPYLGVFFEEVDVKVQARLLWSMIGNTVTHLCRGATEIIVPQLMSLGGRHGAWGVLPTMLPAFHTGMMRVLSNILQDDFTPQLKEDWSLALKTLINLMNHGMNSADYQHNLSKYHLICDRSVAEVWKRIQAIEIQHSPMLKDDESFFVAKWHSLVLQRKPEWRPHFTGLVDGRHTKAIFQFMTRVIQSLRDGRNDAIMMAKALAFRHLQAGVEYGYFEPFADAFMDTCVQVWDGEFKLSMKQRFFLREFCATIGNAIVNGMKEVEEAKAGITTAPRDPPFAIVFTDIEASTRLWSLDPDAMALAVAKHHAIVRDVLSKNEGYEVKTIGDSFVIAFPTVVHGAAFCVELQTALLAAAPFAEDFAMIDDPEGGGDDALWDEGALRVRAGLIECDDKVRAVFEPVPKRYDYYGPGVNLCARVQDRANGGQTLTNKQTMDALLRHPLLKSYLVREDCVELPPCDDGWSEASGCEDTSDAAGGTADDISVAVATPLMKPGEAARGPPMTPVTTPDVRAQRVISKEELDRDGKDKGWIALHGKVYDVSGFHMDHPGGQQITRALGTDATATFNTMHTIAHLHKRVLRENIVGMFGESSMSVRAVSDTSFSSPGVSDGRTPKEFSLARFDAVRDTSPPMLPPSATEAVLMDLKKNKSASSPKMKFAARTVPLANVLFGDHVADDVECKGIDTLQTIMSIGPKSLAGRVFDFSKRRGK